MSVKQCLIGPESFLLTAAKRKINWVRANKTNHFNSSIVAKAGPAIQSLGRCYVQYINKTYRRTGTLWEGRHKSSLVDADRYLLACHRYIELNPVRANMVDHPAEYPWSIFRANALGEVCKLLTPHSLYLSPGALRPERQETYQSLFNNELDKTLINDIRKATSFSMPLGNNRFQQQIEDALGRRVGYARRGRPQKVKCK